MADISICSKPETLVRRGTLCRLAIDHNHATGKVRGMLCARCNTLLGYAYDNINILKSAVAYLERN